MINAASLGCKNTSIPNCVGFSVFVACFVCQLCSQDVSYANRQIIIDFTERIRAPKGIYPVNFSSFGRNCLFPLLLSIENEFRPKNRHKKVQKSI